MNLKAALFDLDGVLFNTEPQYDLFWEGICSRFMPDCPEMVQAIKGTTLVDTYERWFSGEREALRPEVTRLLNEFEGSMPFIPVPGALEFAGAVRAAGIPSAVVTSSNLVKMDCLYRAHPGFRDMFDAVLTSEDFSASKPDPDCYLKAAARLGVEPGDCVVFEDSIKGMQAGRAAGMKVIGLVTTLPEATVAQYSDCAIPNFTGLTL